MAEPIVIVGAGIAGMAAALQAHSLGAPVVVLDRLRLLKNNTYWSGGGTLLDKFEVEPEAIVQAARRTSGNQVDEELWRAFAERLNDSIDWLIQETGLECYVQSPMCGMVPELNPNRTRVTGQGQGIVAALERELKAREIPIYYRTRAVQLKKDGRGRLVGLRAEGPQGTLELPARAVILASGGFQGNKAMVSRHIGPWLTQLRFSGTPRNEGDGHIMALEAGGVLTHTDQWHTSLRNRHRINPYPRLQYGSIIVNTDGRRFVDEVALTKNHVSNALARQPGALGHVIFDEGARGRMAEGYGIYLRDHIHPGKAVPRVPVASVQEVEDYILKDGTMVRASSLGELAERLGLPYKNLAATTEEYHQAINAGSPRGQAVPRSGEAYRLDQPPFYGIAVRSMLNCTLDGLKIDPRTRVLHREGGAVPGLYAAGEIVGGFFRDNYQMICGYLPVCMVLGRIAGQEAAQAD